MGDTAPRSWALLPLEGGVNFRDMGGYRALDGRLVARGVLFRSAGLGELTQNDLALLAKLSIRTVLDYRDRGEVADSPDRLWEGATLVGVSSISAKGAAQSGDPKKLIETIVREIIASQEGHAAEVMRHLYVGLPFDNPAYRRLFELLLHSDPAKGGLVQHCALGKDRTGVGSALTLLLLGVPVETVMMDYLETEEILKPHRRDILSKKFTAHENSPLCEDIVAKLTPLLEARSEYLELSLDAILKRYGSFDDYFARELALSCADVDALRARYLS